MTQTRHVKQLLAMPRKVTDGRGNIQLYSGHACGHYEEIPLAFADDEIRCLFDLAIRRADDPDLKAEVEALSDTPAMREAIRTFVGWGVDEDDTLWVAVCHNSRCYPGSWSDQQVASCEVFVHGVVTRDGPITRVAVPGPQATCEKGCYKRTAHFFDVELMEIPADSTMGSMYIGKTYQIVLRCENCHYGRDLVTQKSSPTRWKRLMKDETARRLLAGARPLREPGA